MPSDVITECVEKIDAEIDRLSIARKVLLGELVKVELSEGRDQSPDKNKTERKPRKKREEIGKNKPAPAKKKSAKVRYFPNQVDVVGALTANPDGLTTFAIKEWLKENLNVSTNDARLKKVLDSGRGKRWEEGMNAKWTLIEK